MDKNEYIYDEEKNKIKNINSDKEYEKDKEYEINNEIYVFTVYKRKRDNKYSIYIRKKEKKKIKKAPIIKEINNMSDEKLKIIKEYIEKIKKN